MHVDTEAAILHDCHCFLQNTGWKPISSEVYRGFVLHCWGVAHNDWCALPVEVPIEEIAPLIGHVPVRAHLLGRGEQTQCFSSLRKPHLLIDEFWAKMWTRREP